MSNQPIGFGERKSREGYAPVKPSHAQLFQLQIPDWALKLPDGRDVRDLNPSEFSKAVNPLGLGLDQSKGHQDRVAEYAAKLGNIYDAAGREAVARFLQEAPK